MKTLIKNIPSKEIREMAIGYAMNEATTINPSESRTKAEQREIIWAFDWSKTKEGHSFWWGVEDNLIHI